MWLSSLRTNCANFPWKLKESDGAKCYTAFQVFLFLYVHVHIYRYTQQYIFKLENPYHPRREFIYPEGQTLVSFSKAIRPNFIFILNFISWLSWVASWSRIVNFWLLIWFRWSYKDDIICFASRFASHINVDIYFFMCVTRSIVGERRDICYL